jgi:oligopeptide/dipeptide ABC transporter ATP-binding protein
MPPPATPGPDLLEVEDLHVEFSIPGGTVRALHGASYRLGHGEPLALVGESGCGKTVSALAVVGLLPSRVARVTAGSIRFEGRELLGLGAEELRAIRGSRIAMVFQDPLTSLNPVLTVGRQIAEMLEVHKGMRRAPARRRAIELLDLVGIPAPQRRAGDYPHQFSGGMRQRVMLAMAISCEPALLIADEPTTALDVTIQAQILELLRRLRRELAMAVLLITHDLGMVAGFADRLAVMYAGRIVETGSTEQLLAQPRHPYTRGLLRALPRLDRPRGRQLEPIEGALPDPAGAIAGCPFRPRCRFAEDRCAHEDPPLEADPGGQQVACWVRPSFTDDEDPWVTRHAPSR